SLFILLIPPHSTSLFPYTTLFRSEEEKMGFELQSFLTSVIPTGFDLNQKMSMPSLIFVGLNLLITIAIPVVFFIYLRKHAKLDRSEEHTSELQSRFDLVCRLLLEK